MEFTLKIVEGKFLSVEFPHYIYRSEFDEWVNEKDLIGTSQKKNSLENGDRL